MSTEPRSLLRLRTAVWHHHIAQAAGSAAGLDRPLTSYELSRLLWSAAPGSMDWPRRASGAGYPAALDHAITWDRWQSGATTPTLQMVQWLDSREWVSTPSASGQLTARLKLGSPRLGNAPFAGTFESFTTGPLLSTGGFGIRVPFWSALGSEDLPLTAEHEAALTPAGGASPEVAWLYRLAFAAAIGAQLPDGWASIDLLSASLLVGVSGATLAAADALLALASPGLSLRALLVHVAQRGAACAVVSEQLLARLRASADQPGGHRHSERGTHFAVGADPHPEKLRGVAERKRADCAKCLARA